jgi:hypothetical protein
MAAKRLGLEVHRVNRLRSREQIIEEIRGLARSHSPTAGRVPPASEALYDAARRQFGSWCKALKAAGFSWEQWSGRRRWDDNRIAAEMGSWVKKNGPLSSMALRHADSGLDRIVRKRYGSLTAAAKRLGLPFRPLRRSWTRDDVVKAVRARALTGEAMNARAVHLSDKNLYHAGLVRFGAWRKVLARAGIDKGRA